MKSITNTQITSKKAMICGDLERRKDMCTSVCHNQSTKTVLPTSSGVSNVLGKFPRTDFKQLLSLITAD